MATHSSILAWRIPWTEEPGGYSPWGCKESDTTEQLTLSSFYLSFLLGFIFSKTPFSMNEMKFQKEAQVDACV